MTRRAYGSGTVSQTGPSKWRLMVSAGTDPITGKARRFTSTVYVDTRAAALAALADFRASVRRSQDDAPLVELLRDYLYSDTDRTLEERYALRARIDEVIAAARPSDLPAAPTAVVTLPTEPGWVVYVARSPKDEVLYVGMTGNLWRRMGSWRQIHTWWGEADRVEWHYCDDEVAARELERRLIVEHRPPFNTMQVPYQEPISA